MNEQGAYFAEALGEMRKRQEGLASRLAHTILDFEKETGLRVEEAHWSPKREMAIRWRMPTEATSYVAPTA